MPRAEQTPADSQPKAIPLEKDKRVAPSVIDAEDEHRGDLSGLDDDAFKEIYRPVHREFMRRYRKRRTE